MTDKQLFPCEKLKCREIIVDFISEEFIISHKMIIYMIHYKLEGNVLIVYGKGELENKVTIMQFFPPNNSHTDSLMKMGSPNSAFLSCVYASIYVIF